MRYYIHLFKSLHLALDTISSPPATHLTQDALDLFINSRDHMVPRCWVLSVCKELEMGVWRPCGKNAQVNRGARQPLNCPW